MKVPILLPNIFNYPFTYNSDLKLKEGDYVIVPFGKTEITGVVWDDFEKKTNKNFIIPKPGKAKPLQKLTLLSTQVISLFSITKDIF